MKKTQDFYNQNAAEFFEGTVVADMMQNYALFLERLLKGEKILDAGCVVLEEIV